MFVCCRYRPPPTRNPSGSAAIFVQPRTRRVAIKTVKEVGRGRISVAARPTVPRSSEAYLWRHNERRPKKTPDWFGQGGGSDPERFLVLTVLDDMDELIGSDKHGTSGLS